MANTDVFIFQNPKIIVATGNREVEIKVSVGEKEFFAIEQKLALSPEARLVKQSSHIDDYYSPPHRNFLEPSFPFEWLSIRKRGRKAFLNYKHFYPENIEEHTHCDEYEQEVSDAESLEKLFTALNFRKLATVEKTRKAFAHDSGFEIALDSVKGLGFFVEIEATKDFGGVEATRKKIFELAARLGIDASKPDQRGYPMRLIEKSRKELQKLKNRKK